MHKELSLRKSKHQDMGLNLASFSRLPTYPLLRDQVARHSLSFHQLACVTCPRYNWPYLPLSERERGGGGSASCLFSSQASYLYLFLGWHNKEREFQERTHTYHFWRVRDRQGAPIDVKT